MAILADAKRILKKVGIAHVTFTEARFCNQC